MVSETWDSPVIARFFFLSVLCVTTRHGRQRCPAPLPRERENPPGIPRQHAPSPTRAGDPAPILPGPPSPVPRGSPREPRANSDRHLPPSAAQPSPRRRWGTSSPPSFTHAWPRDSATGAWPASRQAPVCALVAPHRRQGQPRTAPANAAPPSARQAGLSPAPIHARVPRAAQLGPAGPFPPAPAREPEPPPSNAPQAVCGPFHPPADRFPVRQPSTTPAAHVTTLPTCGRPETNGG